MNERVCRQTDGWMVERPGQANLDKRSRGWALGKRGKGCGPFSFVLPSLFSFFLWGIISINQ